MPKTIIQAGHSVGSQISSSGSFWAPGTTLIADNATEANRQVRMRSAGTLSNFTIYLGSNSTSANSTFRVRINAGNGNQVITVASGQTGEFTDSSNTDSISAGDDISLFAQAGSAASMLATIMQVMFSASSNTVSKHVALTGRTQFPDTTTRYFPLNQGSTSFSTSETNMKCRIRAAGTAKNIGCYVSANSTSGSSTLTLRINGANGNNSASITAGTTGWFEDLDTDSVAAGDDLNFSFTKGTSNAITVTVMTIEYETTDGSAFIFNADGLGNFAGAGTTSWTLSGGTGYNGSEFVNHVDGYNTEFTFSNLVFFVASNSVNSTVTITLRKNETSTAVTLGVAASTSGLFEDTVNTESFSSTDEANTHYTTAGAGSINMTQIGVHYTGSDVAVTDDYRRIFINTLPRRSITDMFSLSPGLGTSIDITKLTGSLRLHMIPVVQMYVKQLLHDPYYYLHMELLQHLRRVSTSRIRKTLDPILS